MPESFFVPLMSDDVAVAVVGGFFSVLVVIVTWLTKRADTKAKDSDERVTTESVATHEASVTLGVSDVIAELKAANEQARKDIAGLHTEIAGLRDDRDRDRARIGQLETRDAVAMAYIERLRLHIDRIDPPAPELPELLRGPTT